MDPENSKVASSHSFYYGLNEVIQVKSFADNDTRLKNAFLRSTI